MSGEILWKEIDRRTHYLVAPVVEGVELFAFVLTVMTLIGLAIGCLDSLFIQISLGVAILGGASWAMRSGALWFIGPIRVGVDRQHILVEDRKGVETIAFKTIRRLTLDENEGGRVAIETVQGSQLEIGPGGGLEGDVGSLLHTACLDWIRRVSGQEPVTERKKRVFWYERIVRFPTSHSPIVDGY